MLFQYLQLTIFYNHFYFLLFMDKKMKDIFEVLSKEHMMVIRGGFALYDTANDNMLGKRIAMQLIMPENVALSIRVKVVLL